LLNDEIVYTLREAQVIIECWRREYSTFELIRAAITAQKGGGLRYEGKYYDVSIPQYVRPGAVRDRIPIYLAAVNKHMIATAASVADGLIGHPIYTRKYIREKVLPALEGSRCELAPYLICSISEHAEQARHEARSQIAFYYSTRLYHSVLDVHGWRDAGEAIAAVFRKHDFKAMEAAVSDEMVDAIALAGTPDEVRDRIEQWRDLTDHLLLYSPSVGMSVERAEENLTAIAETFGSG
jgi:alkanesulfonate monooxygenase SsuD/methylene tetrahydromethanopterin reductase-like flavin-dependent oxidoreductase (luciferase family)